jgi:hypothetical protein
MNNAHTTICTKRGSALFAATLLCAVALTAAPKSANAAQKTACQILPAATVQTILGSAVISPGAGADPTVSNGTTSYQCFYVGKGGGASLFVFYDATAAQASAQATMNTTRFARMGAGRGGASLAGSKGNVSFMVSVRNPSDAGKLKTLLDAAMRNS